MNLAIFLVSAVGIAFEIAAMRLFAISQWHHFAYMMISIAMFGFGASGSVLSMLRSKIAGHEIKLFRWSILLLGISLVVCAFLSQKIPFETFLLTVELKQFFYLILLYLLLALPFFFVSTCITLGFFLNSRIGQVYSWTLFGSGVGAMGVIGLMFFCTPLQLIQILMIPVALAFILLPWKGEGVWIKKGVVSIFLIGLSFVCSQVSIRVSEYKGLSYALNFPDAKVVGQKQSPLSLVTALRSSLIRETPGQISNYPMDKMGRLPEQRALYFDGGSLSVVNQFNGDLAPFSYLDYVTSALPYQIVESPKALVIGAGGGTDVLNALWHQASHVTALEIDPSVFKIIEEYFLEFSGRLYEREDVLALVKEGRGYLASTPNRYDLIQIALLDSFTASASGVHALSENYLYTKEAIKLYLSRLNPKGVLSLTRWLKTPPRDVVKMFATLVEACEEFGIEDPASHLILIRSWNTATLVLSRSPLLPEQIQAAKSFCEKRHFDLSFYPGIQKEETNRFTQLEEPFYYQAAQALLSSEREKFYQQSLFYLKPATDDQPYFFRFFKGSSLPRLLKGMGTEWVPFVEWGLLALWATLIQGAIVSVVLILLPLFIFARLSKTKGIKRWVFFYFALLGLAFMFLEISFIQNFMLFLTYPVYAVAVVLTSFLIFSGFGSYVADRYLNRAEPDQNKRFLRLIQIAVPCIGLISVAYFIVLPSVFDGYAGSSDGIKILISIILLSPLSFFMGIPFPTGMQYITCYQKPILPWAWGINGCASVMGALLATLVAVHFGFQIVVIVAIVGYLVAFFCLKQLLSKPSKK